MRLNSWLVPSLLSICTSFPAPSLKAISTALLFIVLTIDAKCKIKSQSLGILLILAFLTLMYGFISIEKLVIAAGIFLAIAVSIAFRCTNRLWNFKPFLAFSIVCTLLSFASLIFLDYDLFPSLLYGESRHLIHINQFVDFRISGFAEEPSTFALQMLLCSILAKKFHSNQQWVYLSFAAISIITFSSVSFLSIIFILSQFRLRVFSRFSSFLVILFVMISSVGILYRLFLFFYDKVNLYSDLNIQDIKRYELLYMVISGSFFSENFYIFGLDPSLLGEYVVLDNGPIVGLFFLLGLYGIVLGFWLIIKTRLNPLKLLILFFSKVSASNPLLWVVFD